MSLAFPSSLLLSTMQMLQRKSSRKPRRGQSASKMRERSIRFGKTTLQGRRNEGARARVPRGGGALPGGRDRAGSHGHGGAARRRLLAARPQPHRRTRAGAEHGAGRSPQSLGLIRPEEQMLSACRPQARLIQILRSKSTGPGLRRRSTSLTSRAVLQGISIILSLVSHFCIVVCFNTTTCL